MKRATFSLLMCLVWSVTGCQTPCCQSYSACQPQCPQPCASTYDPCKPKFSLSSLFGNKNNCCYQDGLYGNTYDAYGVAPTTFGTGAAGTFAPATGSCPTCNSNTPIPGVVSYGVPSSGAYVGGPIAPGVTYPAATYAPQPTPVPGMVTSAPAQQYWTPPQATEPVGMPPAVPVMPASTPTPAY